MTVAPDRLALFAVAALALLIVPGPAVLYIVTRSIHQGKRAGLVPVLGIHLGTLVHITLRPRGSRRCSCRLRRRSRR